ncbi:MAG: EamA family transporter [Chitinophagaceae bacterium]|nr:EamA family transporter [Chitinophagaceae bacterium]MCW5928572.1 EamA family transporter [Chitinophagaceae bacterium]
MDTGTKPESLIKLIAAFAVIYIVWGSTYFFIRLAIEEIPVSIMGMFRFIPAGLIMLAWCAYQKEEIFRWRDILPAMFTGCLLLYIGNGAVAWSEQFLASSLVAVFIASSPMWFVLLDYKQWRANFSSTNTLLGLFLGFAGILFLFGDRLKLVFGTGGFSGNRWEMLSFAALTVGSVTWAAGSLYSKYRPSGFSGPLHSGWQMLGAGLAFTVTSFLHRDWDAFDIGSVSNTAWWAIVYLIIMGSLIGYSSYVWLLKKRPATQVSTHAYVNPVVAVLLGVLFLNETVTTRQIIGLCIILTGVLLVNIAKYRNGK